MSVEHSEGPPDPISVELIKAGDNPGFIQAIVNETYSRPVWLGEPDQLVTNVRRLDRQNRSVRVLKFAAPAFLGAEGISRVTWAVNQLVTPTIRMTEDTQILFLDMSRGIGEIIGGVLLFRYVRSDIRRNNSIINKIKDEAEKIITRGIRTTLAFPEVRG